MEKRIKLPDEQINEWQISKYSKKGQTLRNQNYGEAYIS